MSQHPLEHHHDAASPTISGPADDMSTPAPLPRDMPYWRAQLYAVGITMLIVVCLVAGFAMFVVR